LRLTPDVWERLQEAAQMAGIDSVSDYLVRIAEEMVADAPGALGQGGR